MVVPTHLVYALIFEAVVGLIAPPLIALYVDRKLRVGWRWIWYGATVFLIVEIVGFVIGATASFFLTRLLGSPALRPIATVNAIRALRLAVVAGLTEEVGRYVGYLLFFREGERDRDRAVMYGLGSGGFESMVDKTIRSLVVVAGLVFVPQLHPGDYGLSEQKLAPLFQALAKIVATPSWEPILGSIARVGVIGFHTCFAVMVLQVFRRRSIAWLFYAVAFHILIDATILLTGDYSKWAGNMVSLIWAITTLTIMYRLRESDLPSKAKPIEPLNEFGGVSSMESE